MQNGTTNTQPAAPAAPPTSAAGAGKMSGLAKWRPSPWLTQKLILLAIIAAVGVGAFFWGRRQQAAAAKVDTELGNYSQRPVAYLYGDKAVTREELGEYLIARFGAERLDFMLNRKIVELECAKHGIACSDTEVEDRFQHDLKMINPYMTEKEFVGSILQRFGKSLYEWKEDVIRPKILMERLVKATVKITDADIQESYAARYGPRVECRMIVCEKDKAAIAQKIWEHARKGREAFLEEARKQFIPTLAQSEGRVPPIHRHFGERDLEDAAFRLKEGDVSPLLPMKDGTFVILLCEKQLPANVSVRLEDVRVALAKETHDMRVAQKIPDAFTEMRKRANPQKLLDNAGTPSAAGMAPLPPSSGGGPVSLPPSNVVTPPPPVPGEVKVGELPAPPTPNSTPMGVKLPDKGPTPLPKLPPLPPELKK